LAAGLKLRTAGSSRSRDTAAGSLKFAAQGDRVRGFPCYKMREPDREAVRLLNTWKQTGGLTSPALPHGGRLFRPGQGLRTFASPSALTSPMSPAPVACCRGNRTPFCFSPKGGRKPGKCGDSRSRSFRAGGHAGVRRKGSTCEGVLDRTNA
jgi:hypothetical protein